MNEISKLALQTDGKIEKLFHNKGLPGHLLEAPPRSQGFGGEIDAIKPPALLLGIFLNVWSP